MRHFFSFNSRRFGRTPSSLLLLLAIIGWLSASFLKLPANATAQTPTSLRYDQIQQRFVHNAFGTIPDSSDESLTEQLIHYNIRGLELDLHPRQPQDLQPNHERDWFIYHVPLSDYQSSTVTRLTEALRMLQGFHNAQPQHEVITINFELGSEKRVKGNLSEFSYGRSPEMLDGLLREYLGNWLYTPQDLLNANPGATTLHQAVTPSGSGRGWPTTDRLRGKFIFIVHAEGLDSPDTNLYFPGTQNGPPSAQNLATIHSRVCFLIDENAWKNYSPSALAFLYPHVVFHSQFGYAADASKSKQMRQELPGHILRSAQLDDCNLQVCDGDTNRARFTESQKAGMNFLYMNMGSVHDAAFRTGNDQRYPFGSSLLEPDGNYSYNSPSYGVWMHPSVVNKAEPGSQLILGDKSGGDINGQSDRFNFAMFPAVPPNGQTEQYVATIASASNTSIHSYAKGLLMARETTAANSRFFAVGRAGDNHGLIVMYRQQDGANAVYQETSLGYKENYNIVRLSLTPEIMNGKSGMRCRGYGSQSGYTWFQIGPSVWIEGNLGFKGMAVSANSGLDNGRTPPVFFNAPYSDYKLFEFVGLQFSFGNSPWQLFNLNPITLLGIGTGVNPNDSAAMRKLYYPCGENCVVSTETSITAINPSPSALDQDVTVFFKVRTLSGTGLAPTGSVTVYSSDTSCTGTISGTAAGATGSCRLHYAQGGPVGIVANYQGDANYASSGSAVSSHYITRNLTTATLNSSANPIQFGQPLTLTATVSGTAPGGLSPVGTVTFQLDDFLTVDVPLVNGMATYVWQTPFLGLRTLKATYQGDGYFEPSEATINQQVNCATITLNPNTLVNGTALAPYNQPMTVTGLPANDRAFYVAGISYLPPGLTLGDISGVISGVPEAVGSYSFGIGVSDLGSNCRLERPYTMNITCPTITPAALPNAQVNAAYSQTAAAAPAGGNYVYAVTAGTLPPGLTINPTTGAVSGMPTQLGTFNFTIKATGIKAVTGPPDDQGVYTYVNGACNGSRAYTLTVGSTPVNSGLQFYPLPKPLRLLDTRAGQLGCDAPGGQIQGGTSRTQLARRTCDGITIPANAMAVTGNITTVQSGGGYLTLYPSDAQQPLVSNSNYAANEIINNVFTVGLGNADGSFKIFATTNTDVVVDITGYYAPPAAGGLYFHPLPKPIRLLETRAGQAGCFTPGAGLGANTDTPQPARLTCGGVTIPAAAQAIVGNATTVGPQGGGYLTLYPAGVSRPLASSSNYSANQIVNGPFAVGLSAAGEFDIFTSAATHLVVDVLGYYSAEANDANGTGLLFTPLPKPVRLLETRTGQTGCYTPGAPLTGNTEYSQQARGLCGGETIPATAQAIVGNATVVNSNGGYLTLWPSNADKPLIASSNFIAGQVFNRHFTVGLGTDGAFKMYSLLPTDLVVDVAGFFAP